MQARGPDSNQRHAPLFYSASWKSETSWIKQTAYREYCMSLRYCGQSEFFSQQSEGLSQISEVLSGTSRRTCFFQNDLNYTSVTYISNKTYSKVFRFNLCRTQTHFALLLSSSSPSRMSQALTQSFSTQPWTSWSRQVHILIINIPRYLSKSPSCFWLQGCFLYLSFKPN